MKTYIKHTFFLAILLLGTALSSCDDNAFLEETPKDFLAPENAYATVAGIKQGITNLHYTVRYDWFGAGADDLQDHYSIYKGVGTDIAFHGEDPGSTRFLCNYVNYLTPASSYVESYWKRPFILIQQANLLIQSIDATEDAIWTSPEQKAAYRAEAQFFRAFAYRHLVSFFGDVPVLEEAISSAKTDFVRDPTSKAYELMESDLTAASLNLPDPGKEEDPGRITKGAALHLLTEVYLMQQKYDDAIRTSTQVIDKLGYHLMTERFGSTVEVFGTGDVYLDLFAFENQNLADNKEGIWVVQFEPPTVTGGGNAYGGRVFGPAYFRLDVTPDGKKAFRGEFVDGIYTGYSDTLGRGVAWIRPTVLMTHTVWAGNWDNDIRNAPHNIKRDYYYDNPESAYDGQKIDFSLYPPGRDLRDTCQYIYPFFLKMADPCHILTSAATSGHGYDYKDQYAMRLAETYLYRAEAYIQQGKKQEAANDVNEIRNRAKAKPVTAAEIDLNYVLDERARELYGETCRHYVLHRTGTLIDRVREYNNNPKVPSLNIQEHHDLWPIPQKQIDLNIDAPFAQNPGY